MMKQKTSSDQPQNWPEPASKKRGRGRPPKVRALEIKGRADNYRGILHDVWDRLWPALSVAQTENDVITALQNAGPYDREFAPWASLILAVLQERGFPRRQRAQINFLADSLAGLGVISPRRSRDVCAKERAKAKRANHIIRYEFYVECSCGYNGHSRDHACPKCGTQIQFSLSSISNSMMP
jgi:hypothetical protein